MIGIEYLTCQSSCLIFSILSFYESKMSLYIFPVHIFYVDEMAVIYKFAQISRKCPLIHVDGVISRKRDITHVNSSFKYKKIYILEV